MSKSEMKRRNILQGKRMNADCEFIRGYACACAYVSEYWGENGKALLEAGGFDLTDLQDADVEPADIDSIFGEKK